MSQENVEVVRRFLDQAAETPDAVWDIFDESVEWEVGALGIPDFPPTSHSPDGVREFFRRWVGTFDDWGFDVEEMIEAPDAVAVHIHQWGRGKGSGAAVDQRFWEVWTMRDGKAVRVTHHYQRAAALEAAGLSE
ncbi:MAG TPA: nuclear transport factor 2 family protein [Solirubrobacterales bacterium]|nr:nuclear transport factor 2 family protein [Solirubrobacterales bacterium]